MNSFTLVTGGARSGKSSYALQQCEDLALSRCFIATCPVIDPEMDDRIKAHKLERQGRDWHSVEEEIDLAAKLDQLHDYPVVLIDCLTLWVNNLMYNASKAEKNFDEQEIKEESDKLLSAIERFPGYVCCVTNEVGLGIVPDNALARKYRDLVGSCNRYLAKKADEVILVSCGLPLKLKSRGH